MTIAIFIIIILMSVFTLNAYGQRRNRTISHEQYLVTDQNDPGLFLTSSNFRISLGFYIKPNTSFIDVAQYLNSTSNLAISLTMTTLTRDTANNNNLTISNSTKVDFSQCSSTYFDGFKDSNTDYTFMNNLQNAFCLPTSQVIELTSQSSTRYQYANIEIYDKTTSSSA